MFFDTSPRCLRSTYILFFSITFTFAISKTNRVHYITIFDRQPFKQALVFIFYIFISSPFHIFDLFVGY